MNAYKPQKKKKDPNEPKQPLSAYFLFSQEERLKVKGENPSYSICEIAKELGRRWADMAPEVKQRYQQVKTNFFSVPNPSLNTWAMRCLTLACRILQNLSSNVRYKILNLL